jgi:quercetin dioxygenase-like cupin family protein
MMVFAKAGDIEPGHTHQFDHLTLLASGRLRVFTGDAEKIFTAPQMIYIKKDIRHELTALDDNTVVFCIHALRSGDAAGDIISPDMQLGEEQKTALIENLTYELGQDAG